MQDDLSKDSTLSDEAPTTHVGDFVVEGRLPESPQGRWVARQTSLARLVHLHLFPIGTPGPLNGRELPPHPHIVSVLAAGSSESTAYVATSLVMGESLAELLDRSPIESNRAARWMVEIGSALERVREHLGTYWHPSAIDIRIDAQDRAWLHVPAATDKKPDTEAESRRIVFTLAGLLHHLLTGTTPFDETAPSESSTPRGLPYRGLSADLEASLWKGLDPDPDRRHPTPGAFAEALEQSLGSQLARARTTSWLHLLLLPLLVFVGSLIVRQVRLFRARKADLSAGRAHLRAGELVDAERAFQRARSRGAGAEAERGLKRVANRRFLRAAGILLADLDSKQTSLALQEADALARSDSTRAAWWTQFGPLVPFARRDDQLRTARLLFPDSGRIGRQVLLARRALLIVSGRSDRPVCVRDESGRVLIQGRPPLRAWIPEGRYTLETTGFQILPFEAQPGQTLRLGRVVHVIRPGTPLSQLFRRLERGAVLRFGTGLHRITVPLRTSDVRLEPMPNAHPVLAADTKPALQLQEADRVRLTGLTFRSARVGLSLENARGVSIRNCRFVGAEVAIHCTGRSELRLSNSKGDFRRTAIAARAAPSGRPSLVVTGNRFTGRPFRPGALGAKGHGFQAAGAASLVLTRNRFSHGTGCGLFLDRCDSVRIRRNRFLNFRRAGIWCQRTTRGVIEENDSLGGEGNRFRSCSRVRISDNRITGGEPDAR